MNIKKTLKLSTGTVLVVLLLGFCKPAFAQESGGMGYGLKLGSTFNQFNSSGLMIGGNFGGFFSYRVTDFMNVQAELLYMLHGGSRDGFVRDYSFTGGNVVYIQYSNRAVLMHSIKVPLMVGFNLPDQVSESVTPRLILGISYGYMMAAFEIHDKTYKFTDGTEGIVGKEKENVKAEYEPHQFDIIGGVALDFTLSSGKVMTMDVRYQHGLNDINLFKSSTNGGAIHQQILSVNFGIPLPF